MSERSYVLDADNGVIETVHQDSWGRLTIARKQDVSRILDANARDRNDAPRGFGGRELTLAARIPTVLYIKWLQELPPDADEKARKKHLRQRLNSSEFSRLKAKEIRI